MTELNLTVDELIATLARSCLPTILVEGKDDMSVYRWLEKRVDFVASVLPCGGRSQLLHVYDRRHEFCHLRTAFLADKDMWIFTAIPDEYSEIIWTEGYSIENDLYAGANLEGLLEPDELLDFNSVKESIIEWFAFEVEQFRNGFDAEIDIHPNEIVPLGEKKISERFITTRGFKSPKSETIAEIKETYQLKIRGKLLFDLLVRFLSAPKRTIKHSKKALIEISFKMPGEHVFINRITHMITSILG